MRKVILLHWPSKVEWRTVDEDASLINAKHSVFVVADGVTRRGFSGHYPHPSPARVAAETVVEILTKILTGSAKITEEQMYGAFRQANDSVRVVNERLGLWDNHDWWGRDLAGAVASCLNLEKDVFFYGFIADCGVAHLSVNGDLLWHTPDLLAPVEKYFPLVEELGEEERFIRVRRDFRNKPRANHPTYGVLTGERAALSYVRVGSRPYTAGDILAVYSDGVIPFLGDHTFQQLLSQSPKSKILQYVVQRSSPQQYADEKTLILIRTSA